jgi:hypothetical protein
VLIISAAIFLKNVRNAKNNRLNINSTLEKSPLKNKKTHGCADFIVEQVKKITSPSLQHIMLANCIHQYNPIDKNYSYKLIKFTIQCHWQIATKTEEHLQQE